MVELISIEASDMHRQRRIKAKLPPDGLVGEAVPEIANRLGLSTDDPVTGGRQTYQAYLERTNQHLGNSDRVSEVLQPDDRVVLHAEATAG